MRIGKRPLLFGVTALALLSLLTAALVWQFPRAARAATSDGTHHDAGQESQDLLAAQSYFFEPRMSPNGVIPSAAYADALVHRTGMSVANTSANWTELGPYNYQTDNPKYTDPNWSNSGGGAGYVSGRITALAAVSDGHTVFAGGADGGVWKWTDASHKWTPVFEGQGVLTVGAMTIDETSPSSYSVFVGTGEAVWSGDAYDGLGIYKSTDQGATWTQVGGSELNSSLVFRIAADHANNRLYAATSIGLWRCELDACSHWTRLLGADVTVPNTQKIVNWFTDVVLRPGHSGDVVAARGWINGAATNGIYESTDGGDHFTTFNPQGYVPPQQQGRVSLAYAADGSRLYAVVQDPALFSVPGAFTGLGGIYVSRTGDPHGPFNQIADAEKLMNSGSALRIAKDPAANRGYQPGIQAWYNQFVTVDPGNPDHVFVGLEEVFATNDGGANWTTLGPYWNFPFSCFSRDPFPGTCSNTTHSDQHAVAIAAGKLWVGNDGGVWSRPVSALTNTNGSWTNLNQTLGTLQFYYANSGMKDGHLTIYGGLQDNGTAKVVPDTGEAAEPFGGDGGDTVVDPTNADNVMTEYVDMTIAKSRDGGQSWTVIAPNDPNPRFIAPFSMDTVAHNRIVAGGQYVWQSTKGFDTVCDASQCDWQPVYNLGAGNTTSALDSANGTVYAAWCGPCSPSSTSGAGFRAGVVTNAGGSWHQVTAPGGVLNPADGKYYSPRFISALTIDPSDTRHVYATLSSFSRHYLTGPLDAGLGHVFESHDAGVTWTDISGFGASAIVDAPANDVVMVNDHLVVATDLGVFVARTGKGAATEWSRLGTSMPNVVVLDLSVAPDAHSTIIAATHGRGLWSFPADALPA